MLAGGGEGARPTQQGGVEDALVFSFMLRNLGRYVLVDLICTYMDLVRFLTFDRLGAHSSKPSILPYDIYVLRISSRLSRSPRRRPEIMKFTA